MFAYEIEAEARQLAKVLPADSLFAVQMETEWLMCGPDEPDEPGDGADDAFHPLRREIDRHGMRHDDEDGYPVVGLAGHPDFWPEWFGIWS